MCGDSSYLWTFLVYAFTIVPTSFWHSYCPSRDRSGKGNVIKIIRWSPWLRAWLSLQQLAGARPVSWLLLNIFINDHNVERCQSGQVRWWQWFVHWCVMCAVAKNMCAADHATMPHRISKCPKWRFCLQNIALAFSEMRTWPSCKPAISFLR